MKNILLLIALLFSVSIHAQVIPVSIVQEDGQWNLKRQGETYYIKGGGGQTHLDKLVEIGGNSIRTWGIENAQEILDDAEKRGLTVMLGLWVQHERHGFDYNDPVAVRKQLEGFRSAVMKFKDHPALLLWGVGNEVDLNYTNTAVWDAVQDIAAMIQEVDPNHPTSTVTAGLDKAEVALIKEKAPAIDIYGINTYSGLEAVKRDLRNFGWDGPYMITEWGVNGHWECPKTNFGVPIEQTSHEKAESFTERYSYIQEDRKYCVGSYAFLWGHKQETTSTWYGLFTNEGLSSEAVDAIQRGWGTAPINCAPMLNKVEVASKQAKENIFLSAGETLLASCEATDQEGDKLIYHWSIVPESTDKKSGGDAEAAPLPVPGTIKRGKTPSVRLRVPRDEGPYRVFLLVKDGEGQVATANVPFYVIPRTENAEQARGIEFKTMGLDIPERNK